MHIKALIVDGDDKGKILDMEYAPIVKIPIIEKRQLVRTGCELDPIQIKYNEYIECCRGVDRKVVCYSTTGNSVALLALFEGIHFPHA